MLLSGKLGFIVFALSLVFGEISSHQGHKHQQGHQGCKDALDLGIILDASSSVKRKNYNKMKHFVKKIVDNFDVSKDGVHVGIIHYSDSANLDFSFNEKKYHNKDNLKKKIGSIVYSYGGTRTDKALNLAKKELFCESCSRPNAKKVLLVITDGNTNSESENLNDVTLPMKEKGIIILSLGIGNLISNAELRVLASEPKDHHVFHFETFDGLETHINEIEASACGQDLHDAA